MSNKQWAANKSTIIMHAPWPSLFLIDKKNAEILSGTSRTKILDH